jgi:hypothetical protein
MLITSKIVLCPSFERRTWGYTRPPADGASLGGNHAELFHLREDVGDSPGLRDSAVDEAEDEDLVVRD